MKNQKTILNQLIKTTVLLTLFISFCSSCSSDDDSPVEEIFIALPQANLTTYTGTLSYVGTDGTVITDSETGTATISGSSSNYTITFSDNVPPISGLQFSLLDGSYTTITTNGSVEGIVVEGTGLVVSVTRQGNVWTFSNQ